jgi:hypothetical protein
VQGLADQASAVSFGAVEEAIGLSLQEPDEGEIPLADDDDYETEESKEIDYRFVDTDEDGILVPSFVKSKPAPGPLEGPDRERLERVLQDLLACRQLLDHALKDS